MKGFCVFAVSFLVAFPPRLGLANELAHCPEPVSEPCARAQLALGTAQAAIDAATQQRTLWTTAVEAMQEARQAFGKGDYAAALLAAEAAARQAQLGIEQSRLPRFPMPPSH